MSFNKPLFFCAAAILCLVFIAYTVHSIYRPNPPLVQEIAGSVAFSPEWVEVVPGEPLKPERRVHQVMILFANPYVTPHQYESQAPDSLTVIPEVQLVDERGNVFDLSVSGIGPTAVGYSYVDESRREVLPTDRTYRAVRVRSAKPIRCVRIEWICFNPWDYK